VIVIVIHFFDRQTRYVVPPKSVLAILFIVVVDLDMIISIFVIVGVWIRIILAMNKFHPNIRICRIFFSCICGCL
jgi:hypothetical protein